MKFEVDQVGRKALARVSSSGLKTAATTFIFKNLLRHHAKWPIYHSVVINGEAVVDAILKV